MAIDTTVKLSGMTCAGCADTVSRSLVRLDGVISADADHTAGAVRLRFDPKRVTLDQVGDRIRQAGFDVVPAGDATTHE